MSYTLTDLLQSQAIPQVRQITALSDFADIPIRAVSVQELPLDQFIRKDELVLTTAIGCDKAPALFAQLIQGAIDAQAAAIIDGVPAAPQDFDTEYLDYKLSVAVVDDVDAAILHIARHSTHHSEAIITADAEAAARFTACVDSAAVYVNASTRFTDGGEFGLGCEMGISTQKLHARGPMGLAELCTYKYIIHGSGQTRGGSSAKMSCYTK